MADAINTQATLGIPSENLPNFRAHLVRSIEHMIALLDALDTHADLEDDDPLENDLEDRCAAHDDNPAFSGDDDNPGDPEDAEDSDNDHSGSEDDGHLAWFDHRRFGTEPLGAAKSYEKHHKRKIDERFLEGVAND